MVNRNKQPVTAPVTPVGDQPAPVVMDQAWANATAVTPDQTPGDPANGIADQPKTVAGWAAAFTSGQVTADQMAAGIAALQPAPAPVAGPKLVGVKLTRSRAYLAGAMLRSVGMGVGVTPAMVAQLDQLFGRTNAVQSRYDLAGAYHTCAGYLAGSLTNAALPTLDQLQAAIDQARQPANA